jgi:hypothetical protein
MSILGEVATSIENSTSAADSNGDKRLRSADPGDENRSGVEGCDYSRVDATAVARVQAPQEAPTPPGAMRDGTTIGLPGRLRSRMARR